MNQSSYINNYVHDWTVYIIEKGHTQIVLLNTGNLSSNVHYFDGGNQLFNDEIVVVNLLQTAYHKKWKYKK